MQFQPTGFFPPGDKLEFGGQICTAPLPPAFMRGVPEGRGEYRTWMQKSFNLEAICPDFWLKRHPGWVGSSPPSVRTGVLRIMVRLPPAIVYYRFAARSTTPRKRGKQGLRPVSLSNTNLSFCFVLKYYSVLLVCRRVFSVLRFSFGRWCGILVENQEKDGWV